MEKLLQEMTALAQKKMQEGNYKLVVEICESILKVTDSVDAKFLLATSLSNLKLFDEAIYVSKSIAKDAKSICNLAGIYASAGMTQEAQAEYEKAIKLEKNQTIYVNYALFLKDIDVQNCFKQMDFVTSEFYDANNWYVYGTIHSELNDFEKEKECYLKSLKIKSIPQTHYNLSLCYFKLCEYKKGWEEYEWRWKACWLFEDMKNRLGNNFWRGENLKGKSILIWCEQGIGDLIHFFRYIKELENLGATVYMKYEDQLFGYQVTNKYDYHCSILTVAGILGADILTASGKPYLKSTLEQEFPKTNGNKIGLCWCGNPGHPGDKKRSIRLKEFDMKGVYSLVKDYSAKLYEDQELIDWSEGYQSMVMDCSQFLVDLNHTAKIIEWLDVVVTVDTLIAHLAGALGKKTYLILPYVCDWRWSHKYEKTTPWYESVTIFRQKDKNGYKEVISEIKQLLHSPICKI